MSLRMIIELSHGVQMFDIQNLNLNLVMNSFNRIEMSTDHLTKSHNIMNIMYQLSALPLDERNEYLLLHAFYEKNFILPDKCLQNTMIINLHINSFN